MISTLEDLEIPSISSVVLELIRLATDPEVTVRALATEIKRDPGLSARVLQLANSAFFHRGSSIATIDRALALIGVQTMRSIVLGVSVINAVQGHSGDKVSLQPFWRDSLLRACIARALAQETRPNLAQEAYLVGLLQDLGIPLLVQAMPNYGELQEASAGCRARLHALETDRGGLTHAQVIAYLCETWRLPSVLMDPLARHHERPPFRRVAKDVEVLCSIAYIVGSLPVGAEHLESLYDEQLSVFVERSLGCSARRFNGILDGAAIAFESLREPFGDLLPPGCSGDEALNLARNLVFVAEQEAKWLSELDLVVALPTKGQRDALHRMLRALGAANVVLVDSGAAALVACSERRRDMLITSYHLPDMTALELENGLRQRLHMTELRMLVSSMDDFDEVPFSDPGRMKLLREPFNPAALKRCFADLGLS